MLEFKHKKFCDYYLIDFNFAVSCTNAKVRKSLIRELMYDPTSDISIYLKQNTDMYAVHNSYITNDLIKFKLAQVLFDKEATHSNSISAAKVLLGYEDSIDKTAEFLDVIKALKQDKD